MGEVYRAHDERLGRDVAIKVLPDALAVDPTRIARFRREARVAASLNHPNIAAIYGFEELDGAHFLVMELVEGRTLAERLRDGAIPIDEALAIVRQIAEGLESAHENGVVHRDLKPSNIKITQDGKAKILDFGLAKALEQEATGQDLDVSPTISAQHTVPGMVFGTVPYMSPEQARGRPVDRRSDIWSLGCVLYECLAGHRAFDGETATDIVAKVLERDPDWYALPPRTPPRVRELLERCLSKDLKHRVRDSGDVRIELERALEAREWSSSRAVRIQSPGRRRVREVMPWAVAVLAIAVAIVTVVTSRRGKSGPMATPESSSSGVYMRVDVTDPDIPHASSTDSATLTVSPDGMTIAYVGKDPREERGRIALYLRRADEIHARRIDLPYSEYAVSDPFFSPDGRWLGFSRGGLYKVPLSGGPPVLVAERVSSGVSKGATWTQRGIIFSPAAKAGLVLVRESGGPLETLTLPDASKGEVSHRWPSALPDGRHVLFTIKKAGITTFDQAEIALLDLETGSWKSLVQGGSFARYMTNGHIVFVRGAAILAVPFDLRREKVEGQPVTLVEGVMTEPTSGAGQYAIAQDAGSLVFVPGGPDAPRNELSWIDRQGTVTPIGAPLQPYYNATVSPDGTRVAATNWGATDSVVVYDFARRSLSRLPSEGNSSMVAWTPDSRQVLFGSDQEGGGKRSLFLTNADGTGKPRRIEVNADLLYLGRKARASQFAFLARFKGGIGVVYYENGSLWLAPVDGDPTPQRLRGLDETELGPSNATLSPNGRWVAYDSDVSGQDEVYIKPFPEGNGNWRISRGGGARPVWSPGGDELLYSRRTGSGLWMTSVRITATDSQISASLPRDLFKIPANVEVDRFHPDGQRLIALKSLAPPFKGDRIEAILNWSSLVRARSTGR